MKLSKIIIYPIKSLAGVEINSSKFDELGLEFDRRWMIISNSDGKALTQREYAELSQFGITIKSNQIEITHRRNLNFLITLPLILTDGDTVRVKIWDDECEALKADSRVNDLLSSQINKDVSLVYLPINRGRVVNQKYANPSDRTAFTDGFPMLICGEESLNLLNSKLDEELTIERFRPNLVFTGGSPHCEDDFNDFTIGSTHLKAVKPCSRCVITTINPLTSEKGIEPLKTLATYRVIDNKVMFGMNVIRINGSSINVGDTILVK